MFFWISCLLIWTWTKELSSGVKNACPFPDNEVTGPAQLIGVCCPLLKVAVLLAASENTAYVAAFQTSYFRMPTLTQVFLISKPGHFDRATLGNNYRSSCAETWGGAVVSEQRTGRRSCSVVFSPGAAVAGQHFSLQPYIAFVWFFVHLLGIFLNVSSV